MPDAQPKPTAAEKLAAEHPNYSTGADGPYCQGCNQLIPHPGGNYTLGWAQHVAAAALDAGSRTVRLPDREDLWQAVQSVLWNARNYPARAQALILGTNSRPLTEKVVEAVLAIDKPGGNESAPPAVTAEQMAAARDVIERHERAVDAARAAGEVDYPVHIGAFAAQMRAALGMEER